MDWYLGQEVFDDWYQAQDAKVGLMKQLADLRERMEAEAKSKKGLAAARQERMRRLRGIKLSNVQTILENSTYSYQGDTGAASSEAGPAEALPVPEPPPQPHALGRPRCKAHGKDMIKMTSRLDLRSYYTCSDSGCRERHLCDDEPPRAGLAEAR